MAAIATTVRSTGNKPRRLGSVPLPLCFYNFTHRNTENVFNFLNNKCFNCYT